MTDKKDFPDENTKASLTEDDLIETGHEDERFDESSSNELFENDEDDNLPPLSMPSDEEVTSEFFYDSDNPETPEVPTQEETNSQTPHNPLFTPMDSLSEVPVSEDFDESTVRFEDNPDTPINGIEIYDLLESNNKNKLETAKEKFAQIKSGVSKFSIKALDAIKSRRKKGGSGGGNGGDDGDVKKGISFSSFFDQFDWDKILKTIFAPENRSFHHTAFLLTFFIISSFYIGKFVGNLLSVSPKKTRSKVSNNNYRPRTNKGTFSAVSTSNLFNSSEHVPLESNDTRMAKKPKTEDSIQKVCNKSETISKLPFKLKNTIVLQDSVKSMASVQFRGKNELLTIREGDNVDGLATIGKIERLKVVIKNIESGECEYIANIEKDKKPSKLTKASGNIVSAKKGAKILNNIKDDSIINEGNKYKIKKTVRDDLLKNIGQVVEQARAIQIKNPDGSLSFKMTDIVAGSIYSKLDIKDGDIINQINGKPIKNLNEIMSIFGQIKNIDHFQIGLKRNGQSVNKEYNFE